MIRLKKLVNEDIVTGYPSKKDMEKHNKKIRKIRRDLDGSRAFQYELERDSVLSSVNEMPHVHYKNPNYKEYHNKYVDFRIEKMPISKEEKKLLIRNIHSGKPVIGRLKNGKFLLFTKSDVQLIDKVSKNIDTFLPDSWAKYMIVVD